jgi:hypothetical protein
MWWPSKSAKKKRLCPIFDSLFINEHCRRPISAKTAKFPIHCPISAPTFCHPFFPPSTTTTVMEFAPGCLLQVKKGWHRMELAKIHFSNPFCFICTYHSFLTIDHQPNYQKRIISSFERPIYVNKVEKLAKMFQK